jgi:hypothetical protein
MLCLHNESGVLVSALLTAATGGNTGKPPFFSLIRKHSLISVAKPSFFSLIRNLLSDSCLSFFVYVFSLLLSLLVSTPPIKRLRSTYSPVKCPIVRVTSMQVALVALSGCLEGA